MGICLTVSLFLVWGLIHPSISLVSDLPEDMEGSGYDLDSSGDWSEQGENTKILLHPNRRLTSDYLTSGSTHWPAEDAAELGFMAKCNSFLANKEIVAGVIGGGVTGVIFAATLMALLIYKWQNKDDGGYILGQKDPQG